MILQHMFHHVFPQLSSYEYPFVPLDRIFSNKHRVAKHSNRSWLEEIYLTKVFHRIIETVSKNIQDIELFFDYDLDPLS